MMLSGRGSKKTRFWTAVIIIEIFINECEISILKFTFGIWMMKCNVYKNLHATSACFTSCLPFGATWEWVTHQCDAMVWRSCVVLISWNRNQRLNRFHRQTPFSENSIHSCLRFGKHFFIPLRECVGDFALGFVWERERCCVSMFNCVCVRER